MPRTSPLVHKASPSLPPSLTPPSSSSGHARKEYTVGGPVTSILFPTPDHCVVCRGPWIETYPIRSPPATTQPSSTPSFTRFRRGPYMDKILHNDDHNDKEMRGGGNNMHLGVFGCQDSEMDGRKEDGADDDDEDNDKDGCLYTHLPFFNSEDDNVISGSDAYQDRTWLDDGAVMPPMVEAFRRGYADGGIVHGAVRSFDCNWRLCERDGHLVTRGEGQNKVTDVDSSGEAELVSNHFYWVAFGNRRLAILEGGLDRQWRSCEVMIDVPLHHEPRASSEGSTGELREGGGVDGEKRRVDTSLSVAGRHVREMDDGVLRTRSGDGDSITRTGKLIRRRSNFLALPGFVMDVRILNIRTNGKGVDDDDGASSAMDSGSYLGCNGNCNDNGNGNGNDNDDTDSSHISLLVALVQAQNRVSIYKFNSIIANGGALRCNRRPRLCFIPRKLAQIDCAERCVASSLCLWGWTPREEEEQKLHMGGGRSGLSEVGAVVSNVGLMVACGTNYREIILWQAYPSRSCSFRSRLMCANADGSICGDDGLMEHVARNVQERYNDNNSNDMTKINPEKVDRVWKGTAPVADRLRGHEGAVYGVTWGADVSGTTLAPLLASASDDRTVRLWRRHEQQVDSGGNGWKKQPSHRYLNVWTGWGHTARVWDVALIPDPTRVPVKVGIVSCGEDGTVRFWNRCGDNDEKMKEDGGEGGTIIGRSHRGGALSLWRVSAFVQSREQRKEGTRDGECCTGVTVGAGGNDGCVKLYDLLDRLKCSGAFSLKGGEKDCNSGRAYSVFLPSVVRRGVDTGKAFGKLTIDEGADSGSGRPNSCGACSDGQNERGVVVPASLRFGESAERGRMSEAVGRNDHDLDATRPRRRKNDHHRREQSERLQLGERGQPQPHKHIVAGVSRKMVGVGKEKNTKPFRTTTEVLCGVHFYPPCRARHRHRDSRNALGTGLASCFLVVTKGGKLFTHHVESGRWEEHRSWWPPQSQRTMSSMHHSRDGSGNVSDQVCPSNENNVNRPLEAASEVVFVAFPEDVVGDRGGSVSRRRVGIGCVFGTGRTSSLPGSGNCAAIHPSCRAVAIGSTEGVIVLVPLVREENRRHPVGFRDGVSEIEVEEAPGSCEEVVTELEGSPPHNNHNSCVTYGVDDVFVVEAPLSLRTVQGLRWVDERTLLTFHVKGVVGWWEFSSGAPFFEGNGWEEMDDALHLRGPRSRPRPVLRRILRMGTVGVPLCFALAKMEALSDDEQRRQAVLLFLGDSRGNLALFDLDEDGEKREGHRDGAFDPCYRNEKTFLAGVDTANHDCCGTHPPRDLTPASLLCKAHGKEHVTSLVVMNGGRRLISIGHDGRILECTVELEEGKEQGARHDGSPIANGNCWTCGGFHLVRFCLRRAFSLPVSQFSSLTHVWVASPHISRSRSIRHCCDGVRKSRDDRVIVAGYRGNLFVVWDITGGFQLLEVDTGGRQRRHQFVIDVNSVRDNVPLRYALVVVASTRSIKGGCELLIHASKTTECSAPPAVRINVNYGMPLHGETVTGLCWCRTNAPGCALLLSGSNDCSVMLSLYEDGRLSRVQDLPPHESCVRDVACSSHRGSSSSLLVTCGGKLGMNFFLLKDRSGKVARRLGGEMRSPSSSSLCVGESYQLYFICSHKKTSCAREGGAKKLDIDHRMNAVKGLPLRVCAHEGDEMYHLVVAGDSDGLVRAFVVSESLDHRPRSIPGHLISSGSVGPGCCGERPILCIELIEIDMNHFLVLVGNTAGEVHIWDIPGNAVRELIVENRQVLSGGGRGEGNDVPDASLHIPASPLHFYRAHQMGTNCVSAVVVDSSLLSLRGDVRRAGDGKLCNKRQLIICSGGDDQTLAFTCLSINSESSTGRVNGNTLSPHLSQRKIQVTRMTRFSRASSSAWRSVKIVETTLSRQYHLYAVSGDQKLSIWNILVGEKDEQQERNVFSILSLSHISSSPVDVCDVTSLDIFKIREEIDGCRMEREVVAVAGEGIELFSPPRIEDGDRRLVDVEESLGWDDMLA